MDGLPEVFRVVVVLTEMQGFTYSEAAKILRVPVGTVRSRLSRGRSLLQKELWQHAREAGLTAGGTQESANEDGMERKLAAVLYADVAGYSRLTEDDETATHHTVSAYLDLLTTAVNKYGGRVQHFAGDAVLADFGTVQAALQCAVCAQREFAAWNDRRGAGRTQGPVPHRHQRRRRHRRPRRHLRRRVQIADIVVGEPISEECRQNPELWAECVVGAVLEEEYLTMFKDLGFEGLEVLSRLDYFSGSSSEETRRVAASFKAHTIVMKAAKPSSAA